MRDVRTVEARRLVVLYSLVCGVLACSSCFYIVSNMWGVLPVVYAGEGKRSLNKTVRCVEGKRN